MFSGIVQNMGRIVELDLAEKWGYIVMEATGWDRPIEQGESIATQGICLTVTSVQGDRLRFDVLRETFERTNLGSKKVGDLLNLERSLRWGDTMGGHIVIGHVDGVGRVQQVREVGRDWSYEIECPDELMVGMVFKGSVAVDGVSLTIAAMTESTFMVHIIPFTHQHTTFHALKPGSVVNLEVDLIGKFVRRLVERKAVWPQVTWENLRQEGLIGELPETPMG